MDNPELIEATELRLWEVMGKAHNDGLSYWGILFLIFDIGKELYTKADAEYWSKLR